MSNNGEKRPENKEAPNKGEQKPQQKPFSIGSVAIAGAQKDRK